jgi:hypothetical protein
MAADEVKKEVEDTKKSATNDKFKGLLEIAEVRMLVYVIPVALVLLVVALLLGK